MPICMSNGKVGQGRWRRRAPGLATGDAHYRRRLRDRPPRQVGGAISRGLASMRNVIFTAIFIMAILGVLRKAGALDALLRRLMRFATAGNGQSQPSSRSWHSCAPSVPATPQPCSSRDRWSRRSATGSKSIARAGVMVASHEATGAPLVPLTTIGLLATP